MIKYIRTDTSKMYYKFDYHKMRFLYIIVYNSSDMEMNVMKAGTDSIYWLNKEFKAYRTNKICKARY